MTMTSVCIPANAALFCRTDANLVRTPVVLTGGSQCCTFKTLNCFYFKTFW